jgi:hypothetical protein
MGLWNGRWGGIKAGMSHPRCCEGDHEFDHDISRESVLHGTILAALLNDQAIRREVFGIGGSCPTSAGHLKNSSLR